MMARCEGAVCPRPLQDAPARSTRHLRRIVGWAPPASRSVDPISRARRTLRTWSHRAECTAGAVAPRPRAPAQFPPDRRASCGFVLHYASGAPGGGRGNGRGPCRHRHRRRTRVGPPGQSARRAEPGDGHDRRLCVPGFVARPDRARAQQLGVHHAGADAVDHVRPEPALPVQDRQHRRREGRQGHPDLFTGTGANQKVEVRGPVAPPVVGAMNNQVANATPTVTGAVNQVLGLADRHSGVRRRLAKNRSSSTSSSSSASSPTASRRPARCPRFPTPRPRDRSAPPPRPWTSPRASTCCRSSSSCPPSMLTSGGSAKLGIWGTISR